MHATNCNFDAADLSDFVRNGKFSELYRMLSVIDRAYSQFRIRKKNFFSFHPNVYCKMFYNALKCCWIYDYNFKTFECI